MLRIKMIQKTFTKDDKLFSYIIKSRKGARGIRIAVKGDSSVVVTKSQRVPNIVVEMFVKSKKDWISEQIKEIDKIPKKLLAHYSAKDFKENKQRSHVLVREKVEHFNKFYNFNVKSISIKNQKTRWGSCSARGNLSFNYKIVFLPPELQDYIIVHELCHLKEMNHGKAFWDLVSKKIPAYKTRISEIKIY